MKAVMGFLFVLLFVVSCGGGDTTEVTEITNVYVEGYYADLYGDYNQQEDGEIICDDPLFTRVEPFPSGLTTSFEFLDPLIRIQNAEQGNPYLECEGSVERYYTNGTFVGRYTDADLAQQAHDFWNICEVGTEPPAYAGQFGLSEYEGNTIFCGRLDVIPGIVACRVIKPVVEGQQLVGIHAIANLIIHQGVPEILNYDEEICYLRYE